MNLKSLFIGSVTSENFKRWKYEDKNLKKCEKINNLNQLMSLWEAECPGKIHPLITFRSI